MEKIDFAVRYPFSSSAKRLLSENGITVTERLAEQAAARIKAALTGSIPRSTALHQSQKLEEIATYATARMMLGYLNNSYLKSKYAIAEAKRASAYLRSADAEEIEAVAAELGLQRSADNTSISLPLYLKYCPKSTPYRLINRQVVRGFVKIKEGEWIRLLEEAIRFRVEKLMIVKKPPHHIIEAAERLRKSLPQPKIAATAPPGDYPPCIKALLDAIRQHQNLPHTARWFLAVYLIKRGNDDSAIHALFSLLPDYSERITRYQLSHARKQNYSVPSCATVLSYGLCTSRCGIKNPLQWKGKKDERK